MRVLQVTAHFHPNLGGVESHLLDMVKAANKNKLETLILTYVPLSSKVKVKLSERIGNTKILRIPWIRGLFYRFVNHPFLEFIYLLPGLFMYAPFVILFFRPKVVHAHGLVAGFVSVFWGKLFLKKVVISTHSIYNFPEKGLYRNFVRINFLLADRILTLSNQSKKEVVSLGIPESKVKVFTYWVDQELFKPLNKINSKKKVGIKSEMMILFVGRLVEEKGVMILLEAIGRLNKNTQVVIAGDGPLRNEVENFAKKYPNLTYAGKISQERLPYYYTAADVVIVPSTHEEGFGRIILEALSCGTPVVASNRGGIKEAMDTNVGMLIDSTTDSIVSNINSLFNNKSVLLQKQKQAVKFAKKHYSDRNFTDIINAYEN